MRKLIAPAILAALAALALFHMQGRHQEPARPVPPTTAPASSAPRASDSPVAPAPAASAVPGADSPSTSISAGSSRPGTATARPHPDRGAARSKAARAVAAAFMRAFARPAPGVSQASWWAAVAPFLSAQAARDYSGTDPAEVPFTRLTGRPVELPTDAPTDLLRAVKVPTDAGDYLVELQTSEAGLQVTRVVPRSAGGPPQ